MTYDIKQVRRLVIFVIGITVLLLGIVMLVAPGPGLLTIALGLGILATEFLWARRLLKRFRQVGTNVVDRLFRKRCAVSPSRPERAREGHGTTALPCVRDQRARSFKTPIRG
jgi:uncharacterized protein (TIGR02611 family)